MKSFHQWVTLVSEIKKKSQDIYLEKRHLNVYKKRVYYFKRSVISVLKSLQLQFLKSKAKISTDNIEKQI